MSALAELQAKYSPALSEGILRECMDAARRELADLALKAGMEKLREYEDSKAPVVACAAALATAEAIVRALEG